MSSRDDSKIPRGAVIVAGVMLFIVAITLDRSILKDFKAQHDKQDPNRAILNLMFHPLNGNAAPRAY